MTNLHAAVGLAQLESLDLFIGKKRKMGAYYTNGLSNIPELQLPLESTPWVDNIYWVYGTVLDESLNCNAETMMERLKTVGVGTQRFFYPMHQQPVFRNMGLFVYG